MSQATTQALRAPSSAPTTLTMGKAIGAGLRRALADDDRVIVLGEDVGRLGGVFRVTDGLQTEFGPTRVIDTPLAEAAIVGTAVGLAFRGYRPVCEIQFDGFLYEAFDQIVSQLAKMHARTNGKVRLPITIRVPVGGGTGAAEHHSESPEAYVAHTAGLRVVEVSNPQDAYTVIRQAIACDDPVIVFEPKRRYHTKGEVDLDVDPWRDAPVMSSARVLAEGSDVTLVTYGGLVPVALDAAVAASDEGVSVEVIDLRSLSPIDHDAVAASVRRTGRLVVVQEGPSQAGLAAEVITVATQRCFFHLEAPPVRVTGFDVPYPPARLEGPHVPDLDRILDGVDRVRSAAPAPEEVLG